MFMCPYDLHWCNLSPCRSGLCKMTDDKAMAVCLECGAVMEISSGLRLCADCVFANTPLSKERENAASAVEG